MHIWGFFLTCHILFKHVFQCCEPVMGNSVSIILPVIRQRKKNANFLPLQCVDPTFQLEFLPSQKLFFTATSVKLSCSAASSMDCVFSLKSACVSCGGKIYAAHYPNLKLWVYEQVHANSLCLHLNVPSLVFLHTNESCGFQTSETHRSNLKSH